MPKTSTQLDHAFDKDEFIRLIILAKGPRSNAAFARECGISAIQLGRYILGQRTAAPSVLFINKIAAHADNNVSNAELLYAAGYNPKKYVVVPEKKRTAVYSSSDEYATLIRPTIYQALGFLSIKHMIDVSKEHPTDTRIHILEENSPFKEWRFIYIPEENEAFFAGACAILDSIDNSVMVSFVTPSEAFFSSHIDVLFSVDKSISLILIDPVKHLILKQKCISNVDDSKILTLNTSQK